MIKKFVLLWTLTILVIFSACSNPIQTEQKLGSWYNDESVVSGVGRILDFACSPIDETVAFSRMQYSLNLVAFDWQGNVQDTLFKEISGQESYIRFFDVSSTNKMALLDEYYNLKIIDLDTQKSDSFKFEYGGCSSMEWTPDGRKLCFILPQGYNLFHILVLDEQGYKISESQVQGLRHFYDFSISPDGSTIFASSFDDENRTETTGLYKIDIESGDYEFLINSNVSEALALSPDGEQIAYLYRNDFTRVVSIDLADQYGNYIETLVDTLGGFNYMEFLPDGKKLLFLGRPIIMRNKPASGWWAYEFSSKTLEYIGQGVGDGYFAGFGQNMETLLRLYHGNVYNICTVDLDSNVVNLTPFTESIQNDPVFTPEGNEILFVNNYNFYKVSTNGGEWVPFLHDELSSIYNKSNPELSPDGHYLAFEYEYSCIIYDLQQNRIFDSIYKGEQPTWSPQSDEIACVIQGSYYSNDGIDQVAVYHLWEDRIGQGREYNVGDIIGIDWINKSMDFPESLLISCDRNVDDKYYYTIKVMSEWDGNTDIVWDDRYNPMIGRWSTIDQALVTLEGFQTIKRRKILEEF